MSTDDPRILQPGDAEYKTADGARKLTRARSAAGAARDSIRRRPKVDKAYRTGVKVVGGTTVGFGIILMPLPGPGTLVALGGLAILGTESEQAKAMNRQGIALAKKAAAAAKRRSDAGKARRQGGPGVA